MDNTEKALYCIILLLILLIPMIVLLLKLECKYKIEIKDETKDESNDESNEFVNYLFKRKTPMHIGFILSIVAIFVIMLVAIVIMFKEKIFNLKNN